MVLIGNAKITEEIEFHPRAPVQKYHQESSTSCCLSILASAFHIIGENKTATDLANCTGESLKLGSNRFRNIIKFLNAIMKGKLRQKCQQHLRYNLKKLFKRGKFDILNDISKDVTLVQLMEKQ